MSDHPWHLFDAEHGTEVRRTKNTYEMRDLAEPKEVIVLTQQEFDSIRTALETGKTDG